jgi:hypothetical protein
MRRSSDSGHWSRTNSMLDTNAVCSGLHNEQCRAKLRKNKIHWLCALRAQMINSHKPNMRGKPLPMRAVQRSEAEPK